MLLRLLVEAAVHHWFPGLSFIVHFTINELLHKITNRLVKEGIGMIGKIKNAVTTCRRLTDGHGAPALQAQPADESVQFGRKGPVYSSLMSILTIRSVGHRQFLWLGEHPDLMIRNVQCLHR